MLEVGMMDQRLFEFLTSAFGPVLLSLLFTVYFCLNYAHMDQKLPVFQKQLEAFKKTLKHFTIGLIGILTFAHLIVLSYVFGRYLATRDGANLATTLLYISPIGIILLGIGINFAIAHWKTVEAWIARPAFVIPCLVVITNIVAIAFGFIFGDNLLALTSVAVIAYLCIFVGASGRTSKKPSFNDGTPEFQERF